MLELITYLGYSAIGFGIGGIVFRNHKFKPINKEFSKFKTDTELEFKQINEVKQNYGMKAQEVIKENIEIQKKYNRSLREVELLQMQLAMAENEIKKASTNNILDKFLKEDEITADEVKSKKKGKGRSKE